MSRKSVFVFLSFVVISLFSQLEAMYFFAGRITIDPSVYNQRTLSHPEAEMQQCESCIETMEYGPAFEHLISALQDEGGFLYGPMLSNIMFELSGSGLWDFCFLDTTERESLELGIAARHRERLLSVVLENPRIVRKIFKNIKARLFPRKNPDRKARFRGKYFPKADKYRH